MHVLIIKMSSMGDVLHTLPALTDAMTAIPNCQFDWVVEPAFSDIPSWHPAVSDIIICPLRSLRKNPLKAIKSGALNALKKQLTEKKYDLIIDAQGLLKSALITKLTDGPTHGYNKHSAREPVSHYFYKHTHQVDKKQHAVARLRDLFAQSIGYQKQNTPPNFLISTAKLPKLTFKTAKKYMVFCHGTTWETKHYPLVYWQELTKKADESGITVYLPWGNNEEKVRAQALAHEKTHIHVLPKLTISEIAKLLANAAAVISVDTGLGHLSAALTTPTLSLYGPTNPAQIGAIGKHSIQLAADFQCAPCIKKYCAYKKNHNESKNTPCYDSLAPEKIWKAVLPYLA